MERVVLNGGPGIAAVGRGDAKRGAFDAAGALEEYRCARRLASVGRYLDRREGRDEPSAYFTHHFNDRRPASPAPAVRAVNDVLIRVEDAKLSALINGQPIPEGMPLATGWDKKDRTSLIAFGSPPMGNHLLSLRFRDVFVRRLPE